MANCETVYYIVQGIHYGDNEEDTDITQEGCDYIDYERADWKFNLVINLNKFSERTYEVIMLSKVIGDEVDAIGCHIVGLEEYVY